MALALHAAGVPLAPANAGVAPALCVREPPQVEMGLRLARRPGETGDAIRPDGGRLRWAGLVWALADDDEDGASSYADFARRMDALSDAGRVFAAPAGGPADRWGRTPVQVVADGRLGAELALAEGLAVLGGGELTPACRRALLAVEAEARRRKIGAWGRPGLLFDAQKPAGWRGREGRYAVIEGRVAGLGQSSTRFYLNFGIVRSESFSVSIQKAALRRFEASGMRWISLEGRSVRVRGIVLDRGGPQIEIAGPDEMERLD